MGFINRLHSNKRSASQFAAVNAVFDVLNIDNLRADRKEKDSVEANADAVVITHWGVEAEEVERKQSLAKETFMAAGLIIDEVPVRVQGKEIIGATQGGIIIPAAENGGFAAIADKCDAFRLDAAHNKSDNSKRDNKGHAARIEAQRSGAASSERGGR